MFVVPLRLLTIALTAFVAPAVRAADATTAQPTVVAKHVLLIGLDGARADAIRDHAGPAIRSLIDSGTSCWQAQAEKPSVTQVNWASILTGCRPQRHGIDMHPVSEQQLAATLLKVPTLFDIIAQTGVTTVGFLGHWKLYPNETKTPGAKTFRSSYESAIVGVDAATYIVAERPAFCFVYIGNLDDLGHRNGWMSPKYIEGIATVDAAVQKLLDALDKSDMRKDTVIFLTSDHGGHGKSHGEGMPEDLAIPWIVSGPGIAVKQTIDRPIATIDTAATILAALGIAVPPSMDGVPVREAFTTTLTTKPASKAP